MSRHRAKARPPPPISEFYNAMPQTSSVSSTKTTSTSSVTTADPTSPPKSKQVIEAMLETLRAHHDLPILDYTLMPDAAPPHEASHHPRRTQGPTARHITA